MRGRKERKVQIRMGQVPGGRFKVGVSWWRPPVPPLSVGEPRAPSPSHKRPFADRDPEPAGRGLRPSAAPVPNKCPKTTCRTETANRFRYNDPHRRSVAGPDRPTERLD